MGLILNPVAYRIGHVNSWSDSWFLVSAEYVEFLHSSIFLKSFIYYILYKFYPTRFSSWLLSHTEILFFNNIMYIWLYVYEASGKYKITKYIRRMKYGLFRRLRMKTFWLKKRLVDKNPIAISVLNFMRTFGSHIEKYHIIENFILDAKRRNKLEKLRLRYGKDWLGMEEIEIFRASLSVFFKSLNPYGLKLLSLILRSFFFIPVKGHNLNQQNLAGIRVLLFFFSYLSYLVKTGIWSYYQSTKLAFNSKIIFVMLRRTVYWLFFRPFINQLSKFLEYLCSYFGISSVFKVSILTNFSLSAFFISRYIITAIKNGFNYMDIVFPIRKTLSNFMAIKIFEPAVIRNTKLKKRFANKAYYSVQDRLAFIINFVLLVLSKLLEKNIYTFNTAFDDTNFLKQFCLNTSILNYRKSSKKIVMYNGSNFSARTKIIFRRFYTANSYHKSLFYNLFSNRLLLESIEADRRAKRKPLTTVQRKKYNENRKLKRLEKVLKIQEERDNRIIFSYKVYKESRSLNYLRFRNVLKKNIVKMKSKRRNTNSYPLLMNVEIKPTTYLHLFYSIKQNSSKNFSNVNLLKNMNKLSGYIFFVKFFKFIIFTFSKMNYELRYFAFLRRIRFFYLDVARNYFFSFSKISKILLDVYYNFYFPLIFFMFLNKFNRLFYLYSRILLGNIPLLKKKYIAKVKDLSIKTKKPPVSYFKKFIKVKNKKNSKLVKNLTKKQILKLIPKLRNKDKTRLVPILLKEHKIKLRKKRTKLFSKTRTKRHYSNLDEKEKKRDPLSILQSLIEKNDLNYVISKEKRLAKLRYKRFKIFPNSLSVFISKFSRIGKKIPSAFFFKNYVDKNQNNLVNLSKHVESFLLKNIQYINLLLNNVYVHFSITRKKRAKKKTKSFINKTSKTSFYGEVFSFVFLVYLFLRILLLLRVKFPKHLKSLNLKSFKLWLSWSLSILSKPKLTVVSNKLILLFADLIGYLRQNIFISLKYLSYLVNSEKLIYDVKQSHFHFIIRFLAFLDNNVISLRYSNSMMRYFFHLIYSISLNYNKINSFRNALIVRLMQFLDMCWYYGIHNLKKTGNLYKLQKFFSNYRHFFLISIYVFKLLFNKFDKFDEQTVSLLYASLKLFIPFHVKWNKKVYDDTKKNVEDVFFSSFLSERLNYYAAKFKFFEPNIINLDKSNEVNLYNNNLKLFKFFESNYFSLHLSNLNLLKGVFPLKINYYFSYINDLFNSSNNYILNVKFINDKLLSYSNKLVRIKARDNIKSFLYGFKFHFVGRFTRKQQSASMWFRQGFLPTSAMDAQIDYGMFTIPLRYSACTIKVWLYRGTYLPKRTVTFGKWQ